MPRRPPPPSTAGYIHVANGVLWALSNVSGHYQADAKGLYALCLVLRAKGVCLANVMIVNWSSTATTKVLADELIAEVEATLDRPPPPVPPKPLQR